jgi:hypothetical protein
MSELNLTGDGRDRTPPSANSNEFFSDCVGNPTDKFQTSAQDVSRGSRIGTTTMLTKAAFDPETVSLLGAVLEQAIAALPPDDRSQERKTLLASKILSAASAGERDPVRLQAAALAVGPYGAQ